MYRQLLSYEYRYMLEMLVSLELYQIQIIIRYRASPSNAGTREEKSSPKLVFCTEAKKNCMHEDNLHAMK